MKRFITLLALCLLAVACNNNTQRDPVIKGYRINQVGGLGFGLDGLTADVQLDLDIDNPSKARYVVEALQADVFQIGDSVRFANINLKEEATIQPKSNGRVALPLVVKMKRPLSLLNGSMSDDLSNYEADIDLTIRRGALKKNIQKSRVPLSQIIELLGKYEFLPNE